MPNYEQMTNEQLRDELKAKLRVTAEHLREAAHIYKILRSRGVVLAALVNGLGPILEDISAGRLVPEAGQVFFARPATLALLRNVPLEEQVKLADGQELKVAVRTETGDIKAVTRTLAECTHKEACTIIGPSGVRSLDEQRRMLQAKRAAGVQAPNEPGHVVRVSADVKHGLLRINGTSVPPVDLIPALAALGYKLVRTQAA